MLFCLKSFLRETFSNLPFCASINNAYDTPTWETMVAIKSRILRIWDTSATGVRICCIKFAQRVVLVQTSGPDADARVRYIGYGKVGS